MVKVTELQNKLLPVEVTLATGDKLNVQVKRYGITVVDQAQQVSAATKLERGELTEEEFIKQTCKNIVSLVDSWDLMLDDSNQYPLDEVSLSELPAFFLEEVASKVMEALTFQRQKR